MTGEAPLRRRDDGLVPEGDGWFVVNAREAAWEHGDEVGGSYTRFEGRSRFPGLGINVSVIQPGQASCMYHREDTQEDFLVLAGECLLIVEGEERPLRAWDFFHSPAWTSHVMVGAGDGPCVVLAVGARPDDQVVYPADETALRHGAGVPEETPDPRAAYAPYPDAVPGPYRDGDLPDL